MRNIEDKLDTVYNFINEFVCENGFSPSVREICSKCNIKSTATCYLYIEKLKDKGLLIKSPLKKRAITIANRQNDYRTVPLVGTIRAGAPILAIENIEGYYPIPDDISKGGTEFALRVKGDSMINAGIYENDIIIVNQQSDAENGEIIVALIDDSATVKRVYFRDGKVILHPENDSMQDMIFENVVILGVVKGLMRKF